MSLEESTRIVDGSDSDLAATLEKELVRARLEVELFQRRRPVRLGRFEVLRCIGRGSLGVVYEARDTDHGGRVALKLLRRVDGRTISQFKHEFRVLSGIAHENLVSLHELVCERDHWFVSMELIEGVPFDRWLSGDPDVAIDERRLRNALAQLVNAVSVIHRAGKLHRDLKPSNVLVTLEGRLVVLDYGLVSAAYAQKQGGPLIAPSEVGAARGTELGSSSQWLQPLALRASSPALIGTPGYMAPEQAAREPAQEASDWYAVGVMLFEALAHRLPLEGSTRAVLRDKRVRAAPGLRELNANVSHALDGLCGRLLERDPSQRGGAAEIEAWLGRTSLPLPRFSRQRLGAFGHNQGLLEGREAELQLLAAALGRAPRDGGARVWVSGAPGIGKTALLDAFAASVAPATLVLRGRCREEESIPLELFDAIADALREVGAGAEELSQLTLKERAALLAAFPVLGELPGVGPADTTDSEVPDADDDGAELDALIELAKETVPMRAEEAPPPSSPFANQNPPAPQTQLTQTQPTQEPPDPPRPDAAPAGAVHDDFMNQPNGSGVIAALEDVNSLAATADVTPPLAVIAARPASGSAQSHADACDALSRLLAGLATRKPLAILLDDVQWADAESAREFERVFGPPHSPGLLFAGAFRREDEADDQLPRAFRGSQPSAARTKLGTASTIALGPLDARAATELAHALLREHDIPATPELCRKLASDTRGIPFLMTELVRQLKRPRRSSAFARSSTGAIALASAIRARVDALPSGARRLLAVLCVAPAPLARRAALSAAELAIDDHAASRLLCRVRLARSRGGRPIETLEPYHERVRESVLQALSPDERRELSAEVERGAGAPTKAF